MRDEPTLPQAHDNTDPMVKASEIRWTFRPNDPIRREDFSEAELLGLEPAELLAFAADCQSDLRALRETLHEALALVATQQDQLARAARVVESQRQQLRRAA